MATKIQLKIQQLTARNFDFGALVKEESDCGYGGRVIQFSNASIYYHPVMGPEAKEVHGGILKKYLSMGGHSKDPGSGNRLFGFPLSDEINAADGRFKVSRFEWGAIYWAFGGVAVYGQLYEEFIRLGGETGRLGYPVADRVDLGNGRAIFFEHGCLYQSAKTNNQIIEIQYSFPQLGHPWLIRKEDMAVKPVVQFGFFRSLMNANMAGHLFEGLFNGRLYLKETKGVGMHPLTFDFSDTKSTFLNEQHDMYSSGIRVKNPHLLNEKRLYDIVLKFPGHLQTIAPHALYFSNTWSDFKFMHITDLHISRRVDRFRKFFTDKGMSEAAVNVNNFNDNLRQLIRYANKLKRQGELDFIIATGDLVDYVFEDGGKNYYNNNFVHFENILLGKTGKPDRVDNEELMVPIFTALGNHDYRTKSYYPVFTVDIPAWKDQKMEQYGSLNIKKEEAMILTRELLGLSDLKVSSGRATQMVTPDEHNYGGNLNHYFRHICRETSYVVPLGKHKIVMIDGKWDDGVIDSSWDAICYKLGFKGEAADNFAGGSPDSVGFTSVEQDMLIDSLKTDGLVFVGVHAPVLNPKHSEYAWFLRDFIRTSSGGTYKRELKKYMFRRDRHKFLQTGPFNGQYTLNLTRSAYTDWSREPTYYFHKGSGDQLLDYGVMRGSREQFMRICTGTYFSSRPVNLILCGHVHKNWECRFSWEAAEKKFTMSHDFYTENPEMYYHTYDNNIETEKIVTIPFTQLKKLDPYLIRVRIAEDAPAIPLPQQDRTGSFTVFTKPYPAPLNSQANGDQRKLWWQKFSPLQIQTAALGPSEFRRRSDGQPDFRGCRVISVAGDTIEKINYMTHNQILWIGG